MREILFRGQRVDNGEWVYGSPIFQDGYVLIRFWNSEEFTFDEYIVIPKTVGQYTGLTDKNGKKIFEGDILRTRKDETYTKKLKGYYGFDSDGYPQKIPGYKGETEYHYNRQVECCASVEFSPTNGYYLRGSLMYVNAICNEVIGNIHDNPELIK